MKVLRGNDIIINWSIFIDNGGLKINADFSNTNLSVYIIDSYGKREAEFEVENNIISIHYGGEIQRLGNVSLDAYWQDKTNLTWSRTKKNNVVELVDNPESIDLENISPDVDIITIGISSDTFFGGTYIANFDNYYTKTELDKLIIKDYNKLENKPLIYNEKDKSFNAITNITFGNFIEGKSGSIIRTDGTSEFGTVVIRDKLIVNGKEVIGGGGGESIDSDLLWLLNCFAYDSNSHAIYLKSVPKKGSADPTSYNLGFYSNNFVSAKGLSQGTGGSGGGLDEELLWNILGDGENPNKQINISHLTEALSNYVTASSLSNYATITYVDGIKNSLTTDITTLSKRLTDHINNSDIHVTSELKEAITKLVELFDVDENGNVYTKDYEVDGVLKHRGFYSNSFVSAKGLADGSSGGGGLNEELLWSILGNEGTEQISKTHLTNALDGYATTTWVNATFASKSELDKYATVESLNQTNANVTALSTKLTDFLEGSDTDNIINKWKELESFLEGIPETENLSELLSYKADISWVESQLDGKLDVSVFEELFEKVEISTGVYAIRAKYGLYSDKFISAKGLYEGEGSTGASYLSDLLDVNLTDLATNDMLKWNGSKWINIPMSTITTDLSWGNITDKPSWIGDTKPSYTFAEITGKPTTLAGYGITDAYTKTDSDSRYVNVSGDSMTGQLNLQVNGTVPLNINNTNENQESCLRVQSGGVSKSAFGWANVYGTYMYDYTSRKYLYILNGILRYDGNQVLDTSNYSTTLDTRYVKKAGDTMTGTLTINTAGTGNYNQGIRINRPSASNWATLTIGYVGTGTGGTSANTWLIGTPGSSNSLIFNLNNSSTSVGLCLHGHGNTDIKWNNNTVWHAGNDGSGSGLDADLLDGVHNGSLTANKFYLTGSVSNLDTLTGNGFYSWENSTINRPANYGTVFQFSNVNTPVPGTNYQWINQLAWSTVDRIYVRQRINIYGWYPWHTLAYLTDNVASATKLQTPRTIWGQSFDGTANVSGALTGVSGITFTKSIQSNYLYLSSNGINFVASKYYYTNSIAAVGQDGSTGLATVCGVYGHADVIENIWYGGTNFSDAVITIKPSTGNVGIGTTSPSYKLHVAGTMGVTGAVTMSSTLYAGSTISSSGSIISYYSGPAFLAKTNSGSWTWLRLSCADNSMWDVATVDSTITKIQQAGAFEIRDMKDNSCGISIRRGTSAYGKLVVTSSSTESSIGYCNSQSGYVTPMWTVGVGIGGTATRFGWYYSNIGYKAYLDESGNFVTTGTIYSPVGIYSNGYITAKTTSDIRLKTILNKVDYQQKLLDLGSIVSFKYNDIALKRNIGAVDDKEHIGLIYQNAVKSNLVNFCHKDNDGFGSINYIASDYINLIAGACQLNILGLRTLSKRTETLEQRVARLEKENIELKQKLNAYEKSNSMVS